jgi:putative tryptophan/tyrosine transport system substrate-binding protein
MRELGYAEGQNVTIHWRYADGLFSRAVELATELVRTRVGVIAAHHAPAVKASMSVTQTIPIVMSPAGAPLETGLVASLAHPGGNVTGLSSMAINRTDHRHHGLHLLEHPPRLPENERSKAVHAI